MPVVVVKAKGARGPAGTESPESTAHRTATTGAHGLPDPATIVVDADMTAEATARANADAAHAALTDTAHGAVPITGLPAVTAVTDDDVTIVVDDPAGVATTSKLPMSVVRQYVVESPGGAQAVVNDHNALGDVAHGGLIHPDHPALTNARTPLAHAASHHEGGTDSLAFHFSRKVSPPRIVPDLLTSAARTWWIANRSLGQRVQVHESGTYRYLRTRIGVSSGNVATAVGRLTSTNEAEPSWVMLATTGLIPCPPAATEVVFDLGSFNVTIGDQLLLLFMADNTVMSMPWTDTFARFLRLGCASAGNQFDGPDPSLGMLWGERAPTLILAS